MHPRDVLTWLRVGFDRTSPILMMGVGILVCLSLIIVCKILDSLPVFHEILIVGLAVMDFGLMSAFLVLFGKDLLVAFARDLRNLPSAVRKAW